MASFVVGIEEYVADKLEAAKWVVFVAEDGINSVRAATGEELAKIAFDALEDYLGQRPGSRSSAGDTAQDCNATRSAKNKTLEWCDVHNARWPLNVDACEKYGGDPSDGPSHTARLALMKKLPHVYMACAAPGAALCDDCEALRVFDQQEGCDHNRVRFNQHRGYVCVACDADRPRPVDASRDDVEAESRWRLSQVRRRIETALSPEYGPEAYTSEGKDILVRALAKDAARLLTLYNAASEARDAWREAASVSAEADFAALFDEAFDMLYAAQWLDVKDGASAPRLRREWFKRVAAWCNVNERIRRRAEVSADGHSTCGHGVRRDLCEKCR